MNAFTYLKAKQHTNQIHYQLSANTALDFMKLDHALESSAISLYRQIIAEALKRGDTTTRRMFEDIILQEEDHYWTFDDFVK